MFYWPKTAYDLGIAQPVNLSAHFAGVAADVFLQSPFMPPLAQPTVRQIKSLSTLIERATRTYPKPEFDIKEVTLGDKTMAVSEENVWEDTFCSLKHFKRDTDRKDPKVLLFAPMSGHYATLLRGTVKGLLPAHDVYITDWQNPRDIPLHKGDFGLDDYVRYAREMIEHLGPDTHVIAVCQPTVPVLAALSLMAKDTAPENMPISLTLMGGPVHPSASHTEVTKLAKKMSLGWFKSHMIDYVPPPYGGMGRAVYPGHIQLISFMGMNPENHWQKHVDLYNHLCRGDDEAAIKTQEFYDEYNAVMDLPASFYIETVDKVFIQEALANGTWEIDGTLVDPSAIQGVSLLTIEGALDDISAPGQTIAAHALCAGIDEEDKYNYIQDGVGHYGIFNGRKFREEIVPRLAAHMRFAASQKRDLHYSHDPDNNMKMPRHWALSKMSDYATRPNPGAQGLGRPHVLAASVAMQRPD